MISTYYTKVYVKIIGAVGSKHYKTVVGAMGSNHSKVYGGRSNGTKPFLRWHFD